MPETDEEKIRKYLKEAASRQLPDAWGGIERRISRMENQTVQNKPNRRFRLPVALAAHMPVPNSAGSRVLLHIGTNDMRLDLSESAAVDNIQHIIGLIDAHDPTVAIHVALVVPIPPPEIDIRITNFNTALKQRLLQLQATKSNLFIVDMNAAFKQNPNWGTEYIADGVHPTDRGYQVMAAEWKRSIDLNP